MALQYPADDLVLSLHEGEKRQTSEAGIEHEEEAAPPIQLPRLRRRAVWLAAHRVEYSVYYRRLEREEFLTLAALRQGEALGAAMDAAFEDSAVAEARRAARVRAWFTNWAELGWICAPDSANS
jgi:hypothetical protein